MKKYQKLNLFPLGSIQPEGFLREQMLRGKDGIAGHLHELEPEMIADPYTKKTYVKVWAELFQDGWGAEISGNYWAGYIQFAYTLNDPEMIKTAENWVNEMMKKQLPSGYLGTFIRKESMIYSDYNAGGTSCAMRALLAFYEATGRDDVLTAVHRCLLWFRENWAGDRKTVYSAPALIAPLITAYFYTEDERLLEFAEEYLQYVADHDLFRSSYKAMLNEAIQYNSNHTAGIGLHLKFPAMVYSATGKKEYLDASVRRIEQLMEKCVQLSGSPVSVAEYLGPVGSSTETEYCSYALYNQSYLQMSYITGNSKYGDYMEQMFYNGAQGARKKDEKAIAYLNSPNQIYATTQSSAAAGDMQAYGPCYHIACCPVNSVGVLPEFIRGTFLCDDGGNIYVNAYGPCRLDYKDISITQKTLYPFRNNVELHINCNKEFSLNLKIPAWCKGFTILVNGKVYESNPDENGYAAVKKSWQKGDSVTISFKAEVEVVKVDDSDWSRKYPIAIRYGALLFSYHIPEKWTPTPGRPMTPLPEGWNWWNVTAAYEEADNPDPHMRMGLRKYQTSWNIALDENLSPDDITIEELPESGYVWEKPLIKLHTHCYKAPYLCAPYQKRTFETFGDYQFVTDKLPLELVPYGCTNLRITYFPKADLSEK